MTFARSKHLLFALLLPASAVLGCVEESPQLTRAEREALREFIVRAAPTPSHPLEVQFEDKVRLLGYDLSTESITPGQAFTVTWYWQVQRPLGSGWQQFTHLADADGNDRLNQDGVGVIRERYPANRWQENEFIRDVQEITLPADWNSNRLVIYQGFWHEDHRLRVTNGPNDGNNRARALSIEVTVPTAAAGQEAQAPTAASPIPGLEARHTTAPIQLDGQLNEADWAQATPTGAFINTMTGGPGDVNASAKVLWDEDALYVGFEVRDSLLRATNRGRDAHLWEQDCVEIMLDPDGDGANYFELQVAPTGDVFDTHYDTRRQPQPFGHVEWNSGIEARVTTSGTPNDDQADQGYTVELRIPWEGLHFGETPAPAAPPAGATYRLNFYVMDTDADGQRAAGWSAPLEGDFHVPARFGRITMAAATPTDGPRPVLVPDPAVLTPAIRRALQGQTLQGRGQLRPPTPPRAH